MPRRCVADGCSTSSGKGHSVHVFPRDESLRKRCIRAVKQQRRDWDGPSASSLLCQNILSRSALPSKAHVTGMLWGFQQRSALRQMHAVSTIFARSIYSGSGKPSAPSCRPISEKRQQKAVSAVQDVLYIATCEYFMTIYNLHCYSYNFFMAVAI